MPTSGTVAQTQITVETLIAHAFNRAGKLTSTIGGELLQKAREALYFICADLANDGINLWCLSKSVVNVEADKVAYQLSVGTNDLTDVLYRTLTTLPGTPVAGAATQTVDLTAAYAVDNVTGQLTAAGTLSMAVEYSLDNLAWVTLLTLQAVTVVSGAVFVIDLDNTAEARYWRIRDTSGTLLGMTAVRFRKANTEIPMAQLNKNDYANLPNKHYEGQRSLQYWFDKQIEPKLWVWPVSNQPLDQIVIWAASEIQDPGDLTNSLAVPTRWYEAILSKLAHKVAFYIPPNELAQGRLGELKIEATEAMTRASNGESDGSSYQLAPRIGAYTK